jgi:hypothetical protein
VIANNDAPVTKYNAFIGINERIIQHPGSLVRIHDGRIILNDAFFTNEDGFIAIRDAFIANQDALIVQ